VPSVVDVQGVANPTANVTVRVVGGTTYTAARKGEYYHHALTVGNNVYPEVEVKSLYGATQTQTGRVFNRPATEAFTHDADGNLTQDGRWTYVWDGENRLIEMKRDTDTPAGARQRLVFEYDHQGRRIRKQFYTHNGSSWVLSSDTAFAYDGWNLVGELNAAASNARLRTFLWGLDLSGSEQGAGGVGGLWLVIDYTNDTTYHWPAYDGNGNMAALVAQANGSLSARYEYGPFGEAIRATGPMARKNPFRFSTKFTDNETGLIYYGYRFYDPVMGRWVNRDPIGEGLGLSLYAFAINRPSVLLDRDGRDYLDPVPRPLPGDSPPSTTPLPKPIAPIQPRQPPGPCSHQAAHRINIKLRAIDVSGGGIGVGSLEHMLSVLDAARRPCTCIKTLTFHAHGSQAHMTFERGTPKDLEWGDVDTQWGQIAEHACFCKPCIIILLSCHTGAANPSPQSTYAHRVSSATGCTVVAPQGFVWGNPDCPFGSKIDDDDKGKSPYPPGDGWTIVIPRPPRP
jgi:RHS repeat-associated protein